MASVERKIAPHTTLLGQLQRGRGAGYLAALEAEPSHVHALLIECIIQDPREETQMENRDDYYASLALATNLADCSPIETYLETVPEDESVHHGVGWPAVDTLGRMAVRGHKSAEAILRRQVERGTAWKRALEALSWLGEGAVAGLDQVVLARLSQQALQERLGSSDFSWEPWAWWKETNPTIAQMARKARVGKKRKPPLPRPDRSMSTRTLLGLEGEISRETGMAAVILAERTGTEDSALLFETSMLFNNRSHYPAFTALAALGRQANPNAVANALAVLKSRQRPGRRALWWAAYHYLEALPPEHTLESARAWFFSRSPRIRRAGEVVLEKHAQQVDVPMLRQALRTAHRNPNALYREVAIVAALAHLPEGGPYPELKVSFEETTYSHCRRRAAEAMAATDLQFPRTYAFECLWDCEEWTRTIGCKYVDLSLPGAKARLHELAQDPYEDSEVRKAAEARLQAAT